MHPLPERDFDLGRFKGKNSKQLLVVGQSEEIKTHFDLLSKILRAVEFDIEEDAHLLPLNQNESIALFSSVEIIKYDRILLFGLKAEQLGLAVELHPGIHRLEAITLIAVPSLERIASDEKLKRSFWQVLKTEFAI